LSLALFSRAALRRAIRALRRYMASPSARRRYSSRWR
jgi:hypothetical protein